MSLAIKNPQKLCTDIENFIKKQVKEFNRNGAIVGVSGGIDSALTLKLCVNALGKEKVLALLMFERDSNEENRKDAKELVKSLGVRQKEINITQQLRNFPVYRYAPTILMRPGLVRKGYEFFTKKTGKTILQQSLKGSHNRAVCLANAFYRLKHRTRMVNLYYHAEVENLLAVGAANKTESRIGFFVKYGIDDSTDIMPIIGLYKTQVRYLAKFFKLPEKIIKKNPSPDMVAGLTDEIAIGLNYEKLDCILDALEHKESIKSIAKSCNIAEKKVKYIKELTAKSTHMRSHAVCFNF
ncbi:NAD(+) synthase [Candidatus Woesearchaeota archaeon]|nr:MAG: NAD(+) synthase [Candidatus Woesearchaeota archaeon]